MVLELKVPHGDRPRARCAPLVPVFLSYVLSFVYVGIYWNNHHHLLHAAAARQRRRSCGPTCTCCSGCRCSRSSTGWMGENDFAAWPVAVYGVVLLLAGVAYFLLDRALIARHGADSVLAAAVGRDFKGKVSLLAYASRSRWPSSTVDRVRHLRRGGADVAHPGPSHRAGPGRPDGIARPSPTTSPGPPRQRARARERHGNAGCRRKSQLLHSPASGEDAWPSR